MNPPLAHWLTIEDGVVDVVTVALLTGLIIGELDVDRWLFGRKIIETTFFVNSKVALPWRLLAAPAALAPPWGRVLAASGVVLVLTETFELPLGRVPGVPHFSSRKRSSW